MKKTLLAIALFMASACVFAQVNVADNKAKTGLKDVKKAMNIQKPAVNHNKAAKAIPNTTSLIEFNDQTTYTTGTLANHTTVDYVWRVQPDTTLEEANYADLHDGFGLEDGSWYNTWFVDMEDQCGINAVDGFAYIYPRGAQTTPGSQYTTFNAYIASNTPVSTYGMRGIDIYMGQYVMRFNKDQFYIDWSHDANFSTYDSIELNIKGVEMDVNERKRGIIRVNIPNGTDIPVISTDPSELTYFRVRYYSPAQDLSNGYIWIIDNLSYAEAPESRVDIINSTFYNGYSIIPAGVTPDQLYSSATIANTGTDSIANVKLVSNFNAISYNQEDSVYVYTNMGNSHTADTSELFLGSGFYLADFTTASQDVVQVIRRHHDVEALSDPQYCAEIGAYAVTSEVSYLNTRTNETGRDELADTVDYSVEDQMVTVEGCYRWARDLDILVEAYAFTAGITSDGYISDVANYRTAGYKVCVGYTALEMANPLYARGVELVPAMDSCRAGVTIKSSLLMVNPEATTWDDYIMVATDEDDNAIESSDYTLTDSDLNTSTDPQYLDVMYSTERTRTDGSVVPAFNSIYLPFNYGAKELEEGMTYYACYELASNGRFAVGSDYTGWSRFGSGDALNLLVFSPGAQSGSSYDWGGMYFYSSWTDYAAPMIRLVVSPESKIIDGLNDIESNTSLNVYPNPATTHAVASFTLAQRGDVTITVTDLMGRTVLSQNEGTKEAGINYNTNINVSNLNNGTYFCTINVNGTSTTSKLVVNR